MPNGIITDYEVSYEPTDSSQPLTTMNSGLETSFIIDSDLELGIEFNISVRAFTGGGAGEIAYVVVSTLTRPRENYNSLHNHTVHPLPIHSFCRRNDGDCTQ